MVQTVMKQDYWEELCAELVAHHFQIAHVVLDCQGDELRRRIDADDIESGARQWRLDHVIAFDEAREWLVSTADVVIDTTHLTPNQVADRVLAQVA